MPDNVSSPPADDASPAPGRTSPFPDRAPVILDRGHHCISRRDIDPDALKVLYRLHNHGFIAYLVGGAVRDLLVRRRPADFDIGTNAHPNQIKKLFRNAFLIGRRFRLAHIRFHGGKIIEVSTFRRKPDEAERLAELEEERLARRDSHEESPGQEDLDRGLPTGPTAEPEGGMDPSRPAGDADARTEIAEEPPEPAQAGPAETAPAVACRPPLRPIAFGTPQEDAFRRDITVNALFYDIATFSVIDYTGGLEDLREGLIRTIGDPAESYAEDPVRIWRVLRHAARLDFTIEEATARAIPPNRDRLGVCAPSRLYEELNKDLKTGSIRPFIELARRFRILPVVLGGIGHFYQDSDAAFDRLCGFLSAIDASARRDRILGPELSYSLFLWPWTAGVLMEADGDRAKFLYETFRAAKPAVQFPKGLLLDVFQTLVIVDVMLRALATGRMKWALKKRRHYGTAGRAAWIIVRGSALDDDGAFERLFDERYPSAPPPKKRRRPRRRGRRGKSPTPPPESSSSA
jgi:tRNA nucleotidyltransferase/poly(A) polymerase